MLTGYLQDWYPFLRNRKESIQIKGRTYSYVLEARRYFHFTHHRIPMLFLFGENLCCFLFLWFGSMYLHFALHPIHMLFFYPMVPDSALIVIVSIYVGCFSFFIWEHAL